MTSSSSKVGRQANLLAPWKNQAAFTLCFAMMLLAAAVPFLRAFYRVEVDYNEGWNIYNASTVAARGYLYPAKYAWTSVNYPMLSFVVMARLHRLTHEYLFTARVVSLLSLLASAALVAAIVHRLADADRRWRAAVLAGMFTLAVFCANADFYVGMDDPQMLAQVFFLAGLYIYIGWRSSLLAIALAALLFVIGGFIKHNPVDFPLAVLIELLLLARGRTARLNAVAFTAVGLSLSGVGVALNLHYGGPHFIDQLIAPRSYSWSRAALQLRDVLGPILLPVAVALAMAVRLWRDPGRRIAAILLATSLVLGGYFGGGNGVSVNCLFSAMLAVAILIGLFLAELEVGLRVRTPAAIDHPIAASILFLWLLIPLAISGNWKVVAVMRETKAAEFRFDSQVAAIAARPGPALCESLLRCYAAGKPYLYDPFNATRLINLGKLNQDAFVQSIADQRYAVIQLGAPLNDQAKTPSTDSAMRERFSPEMLRAIKRNYVLGIQAADSALYFPARGQIVPDK